MTPCLPYICVPIMYRCHIINILAHDDQGFCLFTNDLHSYYTSFIFS